MGRLPILLAATLKKTIIYCESVGVDSTCVCLKDEDVMTVVSHAFQGFQVDFFSTEGPYLVSETNNYRHEKVDVKRVATEIQENDVPMSKICFQGPQYAYLWRPGLRFVEAKFFRHMYSKCDFCTYITSEIGALRYQCPHCRRGNSASPGLYIAQTRRPEQPMHSVWYRSSPFSYLVTDDLESYPLSQHKEMCLTSHFLSKQRITGECEEIYDRQNCLSPDEVLKRLGKWEDQI